MSNDKILMSLTCSLSKKHYELIKEKASITGSPVSRVVGCLVDGAIEADIPFTYDTTLPEYNERTASIYSKEGGKILDFLEPMRFGVGIDLLMLLRHDLGISKESILHVIMDCLTNGLIEAVKPVPNKYFEYPDDYRNYRLTKEEGHETKRKRKNRSNEYDTYLRFKKKYEEEA